MLSYTTLQNLISIARMIIDIIIITVLLYYCLKIIRNNSRTVQIFKGVLLVVFLRAFSTFFGLKTVSMVADILVQYGFLAVIIIFQPEIRGLLEKLGKSSVFSRISNLSGNEKEALVDELVQASVTLASQRVGALITIEQSQSLSDYIKTGTPMNSIVTADLLTSIFVTTTVLHDGAVIIQGDRIACASAYFLPTERNLPRRFGARHRAAVGISEITDSISIVVSEETGNISIAQDGELTKMTDVSLRQFLLKTICHETVEHTEGSMIIKEIDKEEEELYHSIIKEQANIKPVTASNSEEPVGELSEETTVDVDVDSLDQQFVKEKKAPETLREVFKNEEKDSNVLSILFKKKDKKDKKQEKTKVEEKVENKAEETVSESKEEIIEPVKEEIKKETVEDTLKMKPVHQSVKLEFSAGSDIDDLDIEEWENKMKGGSSNE